MGLLTLLFGFFRGLSPRAIGIGALFIALAAPAGIFYVQRNAARSSLAASEGRENVLKQAQAALTVQRDTAIQAARDASASVAALQAAGQAAEARRAAAEKAAAAAQAGLSKEIARRSAQIATGKGTCDDAIALLRSGR